MRRALSIAAGSNTCTTAPAFCSVVATSSAGASRMSSEFGLNAAPSAATRTPARSPPASSRTRSTVRARRRWLMPSTSRRNATACPTPSSSARCMNARMSLGRQPPPKPEPRLEEPAADAVVVGQRLGQVVHVGAGGLADLRHRVDVGDLGGQERVRRHLHQLRGLQVGDLDRRTRRRSPARTRPAAAPRPTPTATPNTSRSGFIVSSTAKPSRRNSGFQASSTSSPAGASAVTSSVSRAAVPTGTVDLPTTSARRRRCRASVVNARVDVASCRPRRSPSAAACRRRRSARRRTRPPPRTRW